MSEEKTYCTYRVFDPEIQQYIYVGMTKDLPARIAQHKSRSPWAKERIERGIELIFEPIEESLSAPAAREREKYWIQYYADRGHPLKNSKGHRDRSGDRWMVAHWLEDGDETTEEVIALFFKGQDFLWKRGNEPNTQEEMMWAYGLEWDRLFSVVNAVLNEIDCEHTRNLRVLDIARLLAKAIGMDPEIDEVQP
jgi:predicted GIY-YIG superfamily endonuclease